jgi:hypothetical protein
MATANIITPANTFSRTSVASVATTYTALLPTSTKPTSGIVIDTNANGSWSLVHMIPTSSISTGTGVGIRVTGYNLYTSTSGTIWYMPTMLFDGTLAYTTGTVPNLSIDGTNDTKTFNNITQNPGSPSANLYGPGANGTGITMPASFTLDIAGSQMVVVQFTSSSSPTMSVFWRPL